MTSIGIRSVVLVPNGEGKAKLFSRIGESRGRAGAWTEVSESLVTNDIQTGELMVGHPVAIPMTQVDYRELLVGKPTQLLQRLARTVQGVYATTPTLASETFTKLNDYAKNNVAQLAPLTNNVNQVVMPVVSITPTPASTAFVPVAEEVVAPPTPIESEPVMNYGTVIPSTNQSLAVLEVPDLVPYYERTFSGHSEIDIYDYARSKQFNVLLTGDAGTGKTSSARNYAAKRNLPYTVVECSQQIDQTITQGRFVSTGVGNSLRWLYSQLATIIRGPGVVLLNEMSRMTPKAGMLFLRLLEERELIVDIHNEIIPVHPECIIIGDQNVGSGYTGTAKQDDALYDRFNVKLEFKYDTKIESKFIKSPTLLKFAEDIRTASAISDEFSVPMSTRILKNFQDNAVGLGFDFAVENLLNNFPSVDGERDAIKMRIDAERDTIIAELVK
jgi:hypothetical protein